MRPLLAVLVLSSLAALAAPVASGQPAAPDSVARLPPFSVPIRGDFAPLQTSAGRAYAYALGVTGGTVALGYLLYRVLPEGDPVEFSFSPNFIGTVVMLTGATLGTAAGNASLGAGDDITIAMIIRGVGTFVWVGGGAFDPFGSDEWFTLGEIVLGAGIAVGIVYDLATIPRNAARAQRYRQAHPRVSVAPGWRRGVPALGVRVGL